MPDVLIIALGNALRGDDGIGPLVADRLRKSLPPARVHCLTCRELTPELAEPVGQAELVIIVDADLHGPPGRIRERSLHPCSKGEQILTHDLSPRALLTMAEVLFGRWPRAILFTLGGANFDHGQELSPEVQRAIPELVARIQHRLQNTLDNAAMPR